MARDKPTPKRPQVAVLQRVLPHYRVTFFEGLKTALDQRGIDLYLVYGQPDDETAAKRDSGKIAWATEVHNRYFGSSVNSPVWQPIDKVVRSADLVIVEQANRLLSNYWLAARQMLGHGRLAFWGHGANLARPAKSMWRHRFKKRTTKTASHFFAYTELTRDLLLAQGFDDQKITIVYNTIDTKQASLNISAVSEQSVSAFGDSLGIDTNNAVYFVGSLYAAKQVPFLLEAAKHCQHLLPDFQLLVVGDGADRKIVEDAAAQHGYVHYLGQQHGAELALTAASSKLLLNPGATGLNILDSFAFQTPIVTTSLPHHGPEIAYLTHAKNGLLIDPPPSPESYAKAVVELMLDPARLDAMRAECRVQARLLTIDNMVSRFSTGIIQALEQ